MEHTLESVKKFVGDYTDKKKKLIEVAGISLESLIKVFVKTLYPILREKYMVMGYLYNTYRNWPRSYTFKIKVSSLLSDKTFSVFYEKGNKDYMQLSIYLSDNKMCNVGIPIDQSSNKVSSLKVYDMYTVNTEESKDLSTILNNPKTISLLVKEMDNQIEDIYQKVKEEQRESLEVLNTIITNCKGAVLEDGD